MRAEIEKNLQQPHIQSIIEEVAKNRASFIIEKYVLPEVSKFEEKVALLLKDIEKLEKEVQARNDRMDFYFKERKKINDRFKGRILDSQKELNSQK
jgi:hypothetical protein